MDFLLPPYSKNHILVLGAVTLAAGAIALLATPIGRGTITRVEALSAPQVKQQFNAPLGVAQSGNFDTAWANNGFLMIDVRTPKAYAEKHIEGAISSPASQIQFAQFTDDTKLIVYADKQADADKAVAVLRAKRIKHVYTLITPLNDLAKQGYKLAP